MLWIKLFDFLDAGLLKTGDNLLSRLVNRFRFKQQHSELLSVDAATYLSCSPLLPETFENALALVKFNHVVSRETFKQDSTALYGQVHLRECRGRSNVQADAS